VENAFLPEKKKMSHNTKIYIIVCVVVIIGTLLSSVFLNGLLAQFDASNTNETAPARVTHWSGYIVDLVSVQNKTEGVSSITGTWIVPQIKYSENSTYSSVWVGVGGYGEESLIQAGTEQHCENGQITYFAWYELLPKTITTVTTMDIHPGDQVTTSITLIDQSENSWVITIIDHSTGANFQKTVTYNSSQKTAEWVVERPMVNNKFSTLADFTQATITGCSTTVNGVTGSIKDFTYTKAVMVGSSDNDLVETSALNDDGTSFTVTYLQPGVNATTPNA
jgi:hypothetical protein